MTLSFADLRTLIKKHLSIIGKRTFSKDGQNLFSNITVSTAEDAIFDQYITSGAQTIEAMLRQLVTSFSLTSSNFTLVLVNSRGANDFEARCTEMVRLFLVYFSVAEYLSMTHPDMAEKYNRDAQGMMNNLITAVYHKNPPSIS